MFKIGSMCFRKEDMAIISYSPEFCENQEFISATKDTPAFALGYLDAKNRYRQFNSFDCENISITEAKNDHSHSLTGVFNRPGGKELTLTLKAEQQKNSEFIEFQISLQNNSGILIQDIQYPFIVCKYELAGGCDSVIALPHGYGSGKIVKNPGRTISAMGLARLLPADCPANYEYSLNDGSVYYPGQAFAQFMCYYNDFAGLYICCDDEQSNAKRFANFDTGYGVRFAVCHIGDWPQTGGRVLEYKTKTAFFKGDWYDAADIYRKWFKESTFYSPLHTRTDIPEWLSDSPFYVTVRPCGQIDEGPAEPQEAFLPLSEKCIALLDDLSAKVNSSLAVILMGWEKRGPWVFPDCFPPVCGEDDMRAFMAEIKKRGWTGGDYANGTHFVFNNNWTSNTNGYDLYDALNIDDIVCLDPAGTPWDVGWARAWRPAVNLCLACRQTRELALEYVRHIILDWGMESIQFLDQNSGAATPMCFSKNHPHPEIPGKWLDEEMVSFIGQLKEITKEGLTPIHSAEGGLTESCLKEMHQTELRIFPPEYSETDIPMYQYLFHDCVVMQAMMGYGPEPYHVATLAAAAFIYGEIPGGVLRGDGKLSDKDTMHWAEWKDYKENEDTAFKIIKDCLSFRKNRFKAYLLYGEMQKPLKEFTAPVIEWTDTDTGYKKLNGAFHSVWQNKENGFAAALTNWTENPQKVSLTDERLAGDFTLYKSDLTTIFENRTLEDHLDLEIPANCCLFLEKNN